MVFLLELIELRSSQFTLLSLRYILKVCELKNLQVDVTVGADFSSGFWCYKTLVKAPI